MLRNEMNPEDLRMYVQQMLLQIKKEGNVYSEGITCMAGNCSFAVNWQGEMRPCVTLEEPSVPVFETGFESAWQQISEKVKAYRVNEKCRQCRLRPVCKTCVASARLETGEYDGLPEYLCRYAREYIRLLKDE